jgi:putative DNA primase/helicase
MSAPVIDMVDHALDLAARGWHVFPAPVGTKKSHKCAERSGGRRWGATTDPTEITDDFARWPLANVGITTGPESGLLVIDIDTAAGHANDGMAAMAALIDKHGPLPETVAAATPTGGRHLYFNYPGGERIQNSEGRIAPGIDVRAEGGMVLTPPSRKPDGRAYTWTRPPGLVDLADCPAWLLALASKPEHKRDAPPPCTDRPSAWAEAAIDSVLAELRRAAEGERNSALNRAAFRLGQVAGAGLIREAAAIPLLQATALAIGLDEGEIEATVRSGWTAGLAEPRGPEDLQTFANGERIDPEKGEVHGEPARTFAEIIASAKEFTPDLITEASAVVRECAALSPIEREAVFRVIKERTGIALGALRAQLSQGKEEVSAPDHLELARQVIEQKGDGNLLCAEAHVWGWQESGVWAKLDERAIKQDVQRALDRAQIVNVNASTVNGVADVFKTEIFVQGHEFNIGNPEAVNCLNGQVELSARRWILKPHCRDEYRTTQIPVAFDPEASAPRFEKFLGEVFRDDNDRDDKRQALLELIGYTLMSHARHEKFVILLGEGSNGKSVVLKTLLALAGAANVAGVQPSSFDNRFQRAHLHMKLANIVTELKQGEVIADAELKAITSGEFATVEHKHKDPFVMQPFATCWFGTNHMPHTRDFSDALFRRATILTFNRVFSEEEQDPLLPEKLKDELPGILLLSLRAYAEACQHGFTAPASSKAAKNEWRLEADQVAMFVEDACERSPQAYTATSAVYEAYKAWAADNGIGKTVSLRSMRDRLTRLGFGKDRDRKAHYVTGLAIIGRRTW